MGRETGGGTHRFLVLRAAVEGGEMFGTPAQRRVPFRWQPEHRGDSFLAAEWEEGEKELPSTPRKPCWHC